MALSSDFIHAASGARAPLLREVVALRLGGDAALNRAAQSAALGNTKELAAMLSSLMQSPEGMAVMSRISESAKK